MKRAETLQCQMFADSRRKTVALHHTGVHDCHASQPVQSISGQPQEDSILPA